MSRSVENVEYTYKDNTAVLPQSGNYCSACGESILEPADLKSNRKSLAGFRASVDNLLTPDEIRSIRKRLKLTQQQASQICGGGKNAFSRYESGELIIPRAASNLLKVLAQEKSLLTAVTTEVA